jgi:iron complex outermembrane receptor protein
MPAPNLNANAVIRYDFDPTSFGNFSVQADGRYQGDTFHSVDASPFEHQDAYGLLNLRMFWISVDGRYTVDAFIQNVTDELYATTFFYTPGSAGFIDTRYYSAGLPRTWGVKLGYEF